MATKFRTKSEDALLLALACGATQESAAQKSGLSRHMIARRVAEPTFRRKAAR